MITKEKFVEIIERQEIQAARLETLCNDGFPAYDMEVIDYGNWAFLDCLKLSFGDDTVDIITWWLWEVEDRTKPCMWDKDNNVIPTSTVEDLWEIVKDDRI